MGSFASGVSVVTTLGRDGIPRGFTCSAICSVSADPPLLLACVDSRSSTLAEVLRCGRFAVNLLGSQAQEVSQLFASRTEDKFARVRWQPGPATGMPLLQVNVAHAECEVADSVTMGDHTLLVGRLVDGGTIRGGLPLTYWRGGYTRLIGGGGS